MTEDPQFKKVLQGFELRCARQEMCSADVRRKALRRTMPAMRLHLPGKSPA